MTQGFLNIIAAINANQFESHQVNFIVYYNNGDLILMDSETAAETRLFYNLAGGIGMKALS